MASSRASCASLELIGVYRLVSSMRWHGNSRLTSLAISDSGFVNATTVAPRSRASRAARANSRQRPRVRQQNEHVVRFRDRCKLQNHRYVVKRCAGNAQPKKLVARIRRHVARRTEPGEGDLPGVFHRGNRFLDRHRRELSTHVDQRLDRRVHHLDNRIRGRVVRADVAVNVARRTTECLCHPDGEFAKPLESQAFAEAQNRRLTGLAFPGEPCKGDVRGFLGMIQDPASHPLFGGTQARQAFRNLGKHVVKLQRL